MSPLTRQQASLNSLHFPYRVFGGGGGRMGREERLLLLQGHSILILCALSFLIKICSQGKIHYESLMYLSFGMGMSSLPWKANQKVMGKFSQEKAVHVLLGVLVITYGHKNLLNWIKAGSRRHIIIFTITSIEDWKIVAHMVHCISAILSTVILTVILIL